MRKLNKLKSLCALILVVAMIVGLCPASLIEARAEGEVPTEPKVTVEQNGPRLVAKVENLEAVSYQWMISDDVTGSFVNIDGATEKYYDYSEADEEKYFKVLVNNSMESEVKQQVGKLIVFDLAKEVITLGETYSGQDKNGNPVSGNHEPSNIYVIGQSDNANYTTHNIEFTGNLDNQPFDVTLDGVHMGNDESTYPDRTPESQSGIGSYTTGTINIPASNSAEKDVVLRLKGENIVRVIHYYSTYTNGKSSLKITDVNGDGASDGGELYVPKKVDSDKIDEFVNQDKSYNHWNSGIGGDDGSGDAVSNFEIAGGKLQVLTTLGDNCNAIGAGGNGPCQMVISGGDIVAHCSGTGAAIGGGIGWHSTGGSSNITITGGKIYAKNHGDLTRTIDGQEVRVGGVAIGSGSSFKANGNTSTVNITGGDIEAYGTFGNGIGGGNSSMGTGGSATITISGGKVKASSIGGGDSKTGVGGAATVTINDPAEVELTKGIGGGDSRESTGGAATINVTGGTLECGGVIGGGTGGTGTNGHGGMATINVTGGTLTAKSIGGGTGGINGNGGAAVIKISEDNGKSKIETGSIGGGTTLNPNGNLGYATAVISGGDVSGQFLMAAAGDTPCSFKMTGGILHNVDTSDNSKYEYAQPNGAAVYMDDPTGICELSGGTITDCSAQTGGAVYMTAGTFTISGTGSITGNNAVNGGGVYLGGGTMNVDGGSITENSATNDGGGALVEGGNVYVTAGQICNNEAVNNGGGIAVKNGNYKMLGGNVDNNKTLAGSGGGVYVASQNDDESNEDTETGETKNITVDILSGSVSNNSSAVSGGAVAVEGDVNGSENITVTVGVNKVHYDTEGNRIDCQHGSETALTCPVVKNNISTVSGGAVYVTGNENTLLNIYCLEESGSSSNGEKGQSNFMKMEGGKVIISTSETQNEETKNDTHGSIQIENSIYVTGGKIDIWGNMTNPSIEDIITVDITKEDDHFLDHRINDSFYKLLYYENFTDPVTKVTTGQYKEKAIPFFGEETISGSIYSHPGYNIVGWNTDPEGDHNWPAESEGKVPIEGWYDVGKTYEFDGDPRGDLTIYAIWEPNGYAVKYDPNVPSGEKYSGYMADDSFTYDLPIRLKKNVYKYSGHIFLGWSKDKNAVEPTYKDEEEVTNLTTEKGEIVTLYAVWENCNHDPQEHSYTYSVVDEGKTLRRDCECEGYYETAALYIEDKVFDRVQHPENMEDIVTYSSETWTPSVVYSVVTLDEEGNVISSEELPDGELPINAGTYMASVSDGPENASEEEIKTASITYVIEKAEQPSPGKPVFEAGKKDDGTSILKIEAIGDSPYVALDGSVSHPKVKPYDCTKQYKLVYYVGDEIIETGWVDETETLIEDKYGAVFDLDVALTNYYVYVRYSEGSNYLASEETQADSVYFFAGDVEVEVICGDGVNYKLDIADGSSTTTPEGIGIDIILKDGYYFPDIYEVTAVTNNKDGSTHSTQATISAIDANTDFANGYAQYELSSIPGTCKIVVTIPSAKKIPTMDAKIIEKQVFGTVTKTAADISRDSAFTTYFEVHDYDTSVYSGLTLTFDSVLPEKTTLIMLNKADSTYYWMAVENNREGATETSVNIVDEFIRMGTESEKISLTDGEMKLQFIVDFSEAGSGISGDDITVSLESVKSASLESETRVQDFHANIDSTLKNVSTFGLSASAESGLTKTITHTYKNSVGVVSKFDERHTALVLTPQNPSELPADAYIVYTDSKGTTTDIYKNVNGDYVIPVAGPETGDVDITLVSSLFPAEPMEYKMNVKWYVAKSVAETSPMNGDVVAELLDLTFTTGVTNMPSLKFVSNEDKLYSTGETVNATLKWLDVAEYQKLTVELWRKSDSGDYANTALNPVKIENTEANTEQNLSISLGGQNPGSYRLQATVMDGLVEVAEIYYYFIIE